jgi:hypothetical protein
VSREIAGPDGEPVIGMAWTEVWCKRHSEPFRAEWPKGAALAMIWIFQYAATMSAIHEAAGHDSADLPQALDRFSPLCCFVPDEVREAITLRALDTPLQ